MARRLVRAPRGSQLTCKGWGQEAAMRMLMNNLDPEVAERPDDLIVYGGGGKAARNWGCFDAIVNSLKQLENDETLLVQSGKPVAIFRTYPDAPRVLIANSNLVGKWATQDHFNELDAKGLIMYGQMTAGSWIYIGTQGILQGTYETLAAAAQKHFGSSLKGKFVLTAGLGGMGGAQPLAITMNEGVGLIPLSVGLIANAADVYPELVARGVTPDVVTDQTPAHDALNYVPMGLSVNEADELRERDPQEYKRRSLESMGRHVEAMLEMQQRGAVVFDYGNNLRQRAYDAGVSDAFSYPGFVPAYVRPLFCSGKGPFRWVALSGDPKDIHVTDEVVTSEFAYDEHLVRWIRLAHDRVAFQGLPSRICWLGYGERARFGLLINDLIAKGKISAPIVIGRDHLDGGSVASPRRETEGMLDGSDAIADWPILNALLNAVGGATWVSFHHGGGVGIGYSLHAGQVIVADGTSDAARRLERVLTYDPGTAIARHADAGYPEAIQAAKEHGVRIPMME